MTISVVNIGTASAKTNGTLSITVPAGGVPTGAYILVGVATLTSLGNSPTDTGSNSYTQLVNNNPNGSDLPNLVIWGCENVTTALVSGNTVSITMGASVTASAASVFYVTGLKPSVGVDAKNDTATGSSTSPSATTNALGSDSAGTTSSSGELLLGLVATNGPSGDTFTQDSTNEGGFSASPAPVRVGTSGGSATTNITLAGGYVVWNSTGKPKYNPTITSRAWCCDIVTFLPAAGDILQAQIWL